MPIKHWTKRWSPKDKAKAVHTIWTWRAFSGLAFVFGIILMWLYCNPFLEMQQRKTDVQTICALIKKYNPAFEPQWMEPTAKYLVNNSGPFDPVWLAVICARESAFKMDAVSSVGAEGWYQNLSKNEKQRYERLWLEDQTTKAIGKLIFFYKNGFPLENKKGKIIQGVGKETVFGMHAGYVGYRSPKGRAAALEYMAAIYDEFAQARGLVWKDGNPPAIDNQLPEEESDDRS